MEVAEAARAEVERAAELQALQKRVREVVEAAETQVAALPALGAEPEDAGERLASEKHADELTDQVAALKTQQSDREKRLVTKLMAAREQVVERDAQAAEHAAQVAERDAQAADLRARIAALEASAAKSTNEWEDRLHCVLCMYEVRSHALSPCGHLCMCEGCANDVMAKSKQCPICCQEAVTHFRVYLA